MKRASILLVAVFALAVATVYVATRARAREMVLTGIVTTDDVIVSAEIQGRLERLLVKEGDAVKKGDLLASIQPREWKADAAYYANSERQIGSLVAEAEADLKFQEAQTPTQIRQAEANLAAVEAQVAQAEADLEIAQLNFHRLDDLYHKNVESAQSYDQARTSFDAGKARVESLRKQVRAAQAAVDLAKSTEQQTAARRAALAASREQLAAAGAQSEKAEARLSYTEIRAPVDGVVDTRAALQGEVVNPGQGIVTVINPDDLWVRADVEEGYIDRIRLGDKFEVRLPSGARREGTVFFRGVDADFATQRDVSRTKRDIKTFEIRLRCDNRDRGLAVGMTAFVTVPSGNNPR
jgi:HlyD family secretion protein